MSGRLRLTVFCPTTGASSYSIPKIILFIATFIPIALACTALMYFGQKYYSLQVMQRMIQVETQRLDEKNRYVAQTLPELGRFTALTASSLIDRSKELPVDTDADEMVARVNSIPGCGTEYGNQHFSPDFEIDPCVSIDELSSILSGITDNLLAFRHFENHREAIPTLIPVSGVLISGFGIRKSPFGDVLQIHRGIDIVAKLDAPVKATGGGVVEFAGTSRLWGKNVLIDHGFGIKTQYGHLNSIAVQEGQTIGEGDVIGRIGESGRATGPHLHYQIWVNGTPMDPLLFIEPNEFAKLTNLLGGKKGKSGIVTAPDGNGSEN